MEIVQYSFFDGKACNKCGEWRLIVDYHRHPTTKDGRDTKCRFCKRAYAKSISARATERVAQWRIDHKERFRLSHAKSVQQYNATHRIKVGAYKRKYAAEHPEYSAITSLRYRARKRNAQGSYSVTEWIELRAKYDQRCLCCGEQKPLTADHIIPLSKGGHNTIDNIQPLCQSCNSRKCDGTIDYRK